MRALIMEQFKQPKFVKDFPIPEPKEGQVLIKVEAAPINPSDLSYINGQYGKEAKFPVVLGFEGSGTIVKSGGGVYADSLVNKRVAFSSETGSYAEFCLAKATSVVPISDDLSFSQASCSFVNPLTCVAFLEIVKEAGVKAIVHSAAASALGKMVVRYFQQNGIKVINLVRRQEQVDTLKAIGAEYVLNQTDPNFNEQLSKLSEELQATIFFDAVAGSTTADVIYQMPKGSTVYVYGGLSGQESLIGPRVLIFKDATVKGFWLSIWLTKLKLEQIVSLIKKVQTLLTSDLKTDIAGEEKLEQFSQALEKYTKNMSAGKILFRPTLL
ncbi:hypothetical protein ABPG74_003443 [Tetrahymena malaccensis]